MGEGACLHDRMSWIQEKNLNTFSSFYRFQNLISGQHSRCPWIPRTSKEPGKYNIPILRTGIKMI